MQKVTNKNQHKSDSNPDAGHTMYEQNLICRNSKKILMLT